MPTEQDVGRAASGAQHPAETHGFKNAHGGEHADSNPGRTQHLVPDDSDEEHQTVAKLLQGAFQLKTLATMNEQYFEFTSPDTQAQVQACNKS